MISRDHPLEPPANPGASSAAVVYDTGAVSLAGIGAGNASRIRKRCRVAVYTNVADAVIRVEWAAPGSSNLRTIQADVTIGANTYTQRDIRLQPGRTKISIVTTTGPSTWEVGADLADDQALGQ